MKKMLAALVLLATLLSFLNPNPLLAAPAHVSDPSKTSNSTIDQVNNNIQQETGDYTYTFFLPFLAAEKLCDYEIGLSVSVADGRGNYSQVKPGDRVCILAGTRNSLVLKNFEGMADRPIIFINYGGQVVIKSTRSHGIMIQNSRFFRLTGSGSPNVNYGIEVTNATNVGIYLTNKSSDFEIDHVEVANIAGTTTGLGILAKTNGFCSDGSQNDYDYDGDGRVRWDLDDVVNRGSFTQHNSVLHDNYIHHTKATGFYLGSSFYLGKQENCGSGSEIVYAPVLEGVSIYNNVLEDIGNKGIQVGSGVENCAIHHNEIYRDSQANHPVFRGAIMNNNGSVCDIYNNFIKDSGSWGMYIQGNGGNKIYNNVIVNPGQLRSAGGSDDGHGIAVTTGSNQGNSIYVFNNTIVEPKNLGIVFNNNEGTDNRIQNNVVVDPGSYVSYGEDAYIRTGSRTDVVVSNNLNARNFADAGIDPATFQPYAGSPAIDSGTNLSSEGVRKDYNGNPRPQGLGFDRGAFESAGTFTPPVTEYAIFRAPNSPMIDGDLSEFQATEFITITQPETGDQGTFKFLWDDSALYVAAWVTDSQLNAEIVEKDGSLWEEDSLELMFDTLHNHGTCLQADDYKFFVNLLNTHRDSQGGDESWDGAYDSVVRLSGSNNDNNDVDQGYSIEMCIPWSSMNLSSPSPGVIWGLDVGLNDRDATGTRYNAAWANIDGGSLNNPDGWGAVEFVADTPTSD